MMMTIYDAAAAAAATAVDDDDDDDDDENIVYRKATDMVGSSEISENFLRNF